MTIDGIAKIRIDIVLGSRFERHDGEHRWLTPFKPFRRTSLNIIASVVLNVKVDIPNPGGFPRNGRINWSHVPLAFSRNVFDLDE